MNNQEVIDNLIQVRANLITSVYWGEPVADKSDVESLVLLRDTLILLGWEPTDRIGLRIDYEGEETWYVIVVDDEENGFRVFDTYDYEEHDFDTYEKFLEWLAVGKD